MTITIKNIVRLLQLGECLLIAEPRVEGGLSGRCQLKAGHAVYYRSYSYFLLYMPLDLGSASHFNLVVMHARYWWVWFDCPASEVDMYWPRSIRLFVVQSREVSASQRFEMYHLYGKINRGHGIRQLFGGCPLFESPLLEVLLYDKNSRTKLQL